MRGLYILILLAFANFTFAGDWSSFRGDPQLTGVAVAKLPEKPSLLWTLKTEGPVKSSAIIAQDHVFVGSGDSNIYALDFKSGKKLWNFKTEGPVDAPPLFASNRIYVGSVDGFLYALDSRSGTLQWKYKTEDKIIGSANVFTSSNRLQVIVGSYDYRLHCLDAITGKSNWVYESGNYINGSPAILGTNTVFGGCDGLLHVISLENGQQVKEIDAGAYVAASTVLGDNRAYFGNYGNEFLCIALDTPMTSTDAPQTNVVWRFRDKEFPYFSSAALTKDRVLFGGRDKRLRCVNRATGEEIWNFPTQGKVDSSPVVAGENVVFGSDDGRVYIVSLKDGREVWSYEIGTAIDASPAVVNGKFVIGSNDGVVYCFGQKSK